MGNDVTSSFPGKIFLFSHQNQIPSSQKANLHAHTAPVAHRTENLKKLTPNKCPLMRFAGSLLSEEPSDATELPLKTPPGSCEPEGLVQGPAGRGAVCQFGARTGVCAAQTHPYAHQYSGGVPGLEVFTPGIQTCPDIFGSEEQVAPECVLLNSGGSGVERGRVRQETDTVCPISGATAI